MTGIEHYNWPAFLEAEREWIKRGYEAVTPIDANHTVWERHHGRPFSHALDKIEYGDPLMKEIIAEDLKLLCSAEAIALLPGWNRSRGALHELATANFLGLKVFDAITFERLDSMGRPMVGAQVA
jgi:hypothetical protein